MIATSVAARLPTSGLRQHMYSTSTVVAESCLPGNYACWYSSDCCNGLWCSWKFICQWV
jgi:hypothetical protein